MWDQGYTKCQCPILIAGTLNRQRIMLSTAKFLPASQARDLDAASRLARLWEKEGMAVKPGAMTLTAPAAVGSNGMITLAKSIEDYAKDQFRKKAATRAALEKHRCVFTSGPNSLLRFAERIGLRFVSELSVLTLIDWRQSLRHPDGEELRSSTVVDYQSKVERFVRFCQAVGWLPRGFAADVSEGMGKVERTSTPTGWFRSEEYAAILSAILQWGTRKQANASGIAKRIYALTELMRWTGLRIGDALTLEKVNLQYAANGGGDKGGLWTIGRYQRKTKDWVHCPTPLHVVELLQSVPPPPRLPNGDYFFWSGQGNPKSLVTKMRCYYDAIFRMASLEEPKMIDKHMHYRLSAKGKMMRCHPHMFRDTYAVESLIDGVDAMTVSKALGHKSLRTTEKYYMPWAEERQRELNRSVMKGWERRGIHAIPRAG